MLLTARQAAGMRHLRQLVRRMGLSWDGPRYACGAMVHLDGDDAAVLALGPAAVGGPVMARRLGPLLALLREGQGLSQLEAAEKLCALSGQVTITRHEISRWEREDRLPSDFWLGWLSRLLETPVTDLEKARARTRGGTNHMAAETGKTPEKAVGTKWRDYARSVRESSLALVTLKFEHRATSVQLSGTYEVPEHATAAIGMFRWIAAPGAVTTAGAEPSTATETTAASARKTAAPRTGVGAPTVAPTTKGQTPASPGAAANGSNPTRVPMGIRYTKGPGVENGTGAARQPEQVGRNGSDGGGGQGDER